MKRLIFPGVGLVCLGVALGGTVDAKALRTPIVSVKARPAAPQDPTTIVEGDRSVLEIEIVPDAVVTSANAESIEYHADITSTLAKDATLAWSAEMVDDRGNVVRHIAKGEGVITKQGSSTSTALVATLPDGFYTLRVRAAAVADESEEVADAVQHLRVKAGKMREISATDWYALSAASLAVQVGGTK